MDILPLLKKIATNAVAVLLGVTLAGQCFAEVSINSNFPYKLNDNQNLGATQGLSVVENNLPEGIQSEDSVKNLVLDWVKYFLQFYSLVAVGIVMYLGITLIVAREDEKKRNDIIKALINLAIGTILIYLSYAIVNTIVNLLTPGDLARQANEIRSSNP